MNRHWNGLYDFLHGENVPQLPFMPIFMRFCAKQAGVKYGDFILDVETHCRANIQVAERFRSCWVNVMSDPYCELEAYGAHIEYPEDDLPLDKIILYPEISLLKNLPRINYDTAKRCRDRVEQIAFYRKSAAEAFLITGWVEGPIAEYCDLRGMENAFLDFYDDPALVKQSIRLILDNAKEFINRQIAAGADCIGIGDAAASQIGRELYMDFVFDGECELVEYIHSRGALAKLHICGNTGSILHDMIATGADIIDIDHMVDNFQEQIPYLKQNQFFCGNVDPVAIIRNGNEKQIIQAVENIIRSTEKKMIISGGCEIPPDTPPEHIDAMNHAIASNPIGKAE